MAQNKIAAIIDIGTAETKVFVVDLVPQLKIIGSFSTQTKGMRKGGIVNLSALKESVHVALQEAERLAGIAGRIRSACLAVSGVGVHGFPIRGMTSVKSGIVSQKDKEAARDDAISASLFHVPENRRTICRLHRRYLLDDREIEDPAGVKGSGLVYDMWVVDADETYLSELIQIPNRYGMTVRGIFPASLASAEAVRSFSEMDKNRLVIDIGAGTTDFVLFDNGAPVLTGVIPVGGNHITNDIAYGLKISEERAEHIKIKYGHAFIRNTPEFVLKKIDIDSVDDEEIKGLSSSISNYKMEVITECRLRELFEIISKKISADIDFSGTVFLTGGTAQMPGICALAKAIFHHAGEVRVGEPTQGFANKGYAEPKFATVVGLAKLYRDEIFEEQKNAAAARGVRAWLRKFFK